MKKVIAIVAFVLLVFSAPVHATDAYFPELPKDYDWSAPTHGYFEITDSYELGGGSHYEYWDQKISKNSIADFCLSLSSESCNENVALNKTWVDDKYLIANLVMGVCESEADDFCIESVRLSPKDAAQPFDAEYENYVNTAFTTGSPRFNIPDGKAASLWKASPESGLGDLRVSAYVAMRMTYGPGSKNNQYKIDEFDVFLTPYKEVAGSEFEYYRAGVQEIPENLNGYPDSFTKINRDPRKECAWMDTGVCGRIQNWPEGVRAGISIRIDRQVDSFFSGRLKDPQINIKEISKGVRKISLDAEPVRVAKFLAKVPIESPEAKQLEISTWHSTKAWFPNALTSMNTLKNIMGDANSGEVSEWRLSSRSGTSVPGCYEKAGDFSGIVTTNAIAYEDNPPRYSKGFLDYKVGGMHLESDKQTEFLGSYDLLLKSEVARCIYGFSKAPVSATVTISGTGEKTIATTVVSEKNGWLKIAAYGFTFSEKTIKVKLSQPKQITKKTTITCVTTKKPIKTRKVTAVSPKCPTGFKKK